MNATQTVNHFASTRNANLVEASLHLNVFQLEGPARTYFLKDMYQIANELLNEAEEHNFDLARIINTITDYASR